MIFLNITRITDIYKHFVNLYNLIIEKCKELGVNVVLSTVWADGGNGGDALACQRGQAALKDIMQIKKVQLDILWGNVDIAALAVHGNAVHPDKAVAKSYHDDFVNAVQNKVNSDLEEEAWCELLARG